MSETKVELLPCPFCGARDHKPANECVSRPYGGLIVGNEPDANCVECDNCCAHGPLVDESKGGSAIAAWNRRAPAAPASEEAEEREGLLLDIIFACGEAADLGPRVMAKDIPEAIAARFRALRPQEPDAEALAAKVGDYLREKFPVIGGEMEWHDPDGHLMRAWREATTEDVTGYVLAVLRRAAGKEGK